MTSIVLVIDRNLASQTGEGSISAMRYATTLIQFALGMVSAAISIASLPSLSQHFSRGDSEAYKRTLTTGAAPCDSAGAACRRRPARTGHARCRSHIPARQFQRRGPEPCGACASLLRAWPPRGGYRPRYLIFAFYARKNTLTPVLVGIAQVVVYLAIALATYRTWGMRGLVLAWSAQTIFHACGHGGLLWRTLRSEGGLRGYGLGNTALKAGGAAVLMTVSATLAGGR